MGGPGDDRLIAPAKLVLALGAGLDRRKLVIDRPFDRLVIAKLEVKVRDLADRAPIAAVERVWPDDVERAGNRPAVAVGEE